MKVRQGARYLLLHQAFDAAGGAPASFPHVQAFGTEGGLFEGFGGVVSYERGQSPYDAQWDFVTGWKYSSSATRTGPDAEWELPAYASAIVELFPPPALPAPTLPGQVTDDVPRSHFWGGVALVALGLLLLSPRSL